MFLTPVHENLNVVESKLATELKSTIVCVGVPTPELLQLFGLVEPDAPVHKSPFVTTSLPNPVSFKLYQLTRLVNSVPFKSAYCPFQ